MCTRIQAGYPLLPSDSPSPSDGIDNPTWYRFLACEMGGGSGGRAARAPSGGQRRTLLGGVSGQARGAGCGVQPVAHREQGGTDWAPPASEQTGFLRLQEPRPSPRPAPFLCLLLG